MSDKELYGLLREERTIPWDRAAQGFLMLKVASGGVLAEDVDDFKKVAGLSAEISPEQAERALASGIMSGIRRSSSGDIAHASAVRRKRGERIGKATGAAAGTAAGLLAAQRLGVPKSHAAALGALLGYGGGKGVGQEVDRARAKARIKRAAIEKTAESDEEKKAKFRRMLKIVGGTVAAGAAIGGARRGIMHHRGMKGTSFTDIAKWSKLTPGHDAEDLKRGLEALSSQDKLRSGVGEMAKRVGWGALKGAGAGIPVGTAAHGVSEWLRNRKKKKTAAAPVDPAMGIPVEPAGENPMDNFLQAQQEANEAEFFKQQADEAQTNAQMQEERANMLEQQLQTTQQTAQMQQQDSAMKEQATQQQTAMAQQQAQQAQSEAVMARDESLTAQQANIALRQAVTSYRQQLMDLLSQDPTQQVAPPAAPQAAPPEMQQGAQMQQPAQAMPAQDPAAQLPPGGQAAPAPAPEQQAAPVQAPAPAPVAQPATPDLQMMPPPAPAQPQGAQ